MDRLGGPKETREHEPQVGPSASSKCAGPQPRTQTALPILTSEQGPGLALMTSLHLLFNPRDGRSRSQEGAGITFIAHSSDRDSLFASLDLLLAPPPRSSRGCWCLGYPRLPSLNTEGILGVPYTFSLYHSRLPICTVIAHAYAPPLQYHPAWPHHILSQLVLKSTSNPQPAKFTTQCFSKASSLSASAATDLVGPLSYSLRTKPA